MTDENSNLPPAEPIQPGLRFLEAAVYIMGGLLVLMLVGLLGGIAWKLTRKAPAEPAAVTTADVAVPEGASVAGVTLDGTIMAIHVVIGSDHEIVVMDARKGTVISRIRLKPGTQGAAGQ